ncbi:hypothetical protein H2204_003325 [Knufia peltigerae]|uniref:Alpha-L-arabinofuranosidase II n=1 Tax=Knufia peltigerae TaxID=1002370 RepID=A0AA38Y9R3_9EURO|nr:hypothetical protein H2204_003325 [Knufia peltigerae]
MSNTPIADFDTPDPWMIRHNNSYYLTYTCGDRVDILMSPNMQDFRSRSHRITAWRPPPNTPWSVDLWAPELHYINGTWYIYFCAAHPGQGNPSHRTVILRSSSQDPMDVRGWTFLGPLKGLPDHWNIDATFFSVGGRLFCCYSGWPLGDFSDTQQDLFLVELANPEQALQSTLTCISRAELPWERPDGGRRGVNEGPTWLSISGPGAGFEGIVYSANGSWTSDYTLGLLRLVPGRDPLLASSWQKRHQPLLKSCKDQGGPFGPGHASFIVPAVDDNGQGGHQQQVYCIYHATEHEGQGWANRKARVLCLHSHHFHPQAESCCCSMNPATAMMTGPIPGPGPGPGPGMMVYQGGGGTGAYGPPPPAGVTGRPDHGRPRQGGILYDLGNRVMNKLREF